MHYILSHWRGEQSLPWSFWVNLVTLRAVILFAERFTHPPFSDKSTTAIVLTVAYFTVFHIIVYLWQAVGVIRACDRYQKQRGPYVTVLSTQLGVVVSLFFTIIYGAGAFQALFADPGAMRINQIRPKPPLLGEYTLEVTENATRIHLQGDFKIGITRQLGDLLEQNPGIEGITLSSNGGRVTEGRGVARLIRKYRLQTYVFGLCKSACATAFIGGERRILGPHGRLGFHQFNLATETQTPYIDPVQEQKIDLAFYAEQKIDAAFLDKVFQARHTDIWFPTIEALLDAGVVHTVVE